MITSLILFPRASFRYEFPSLKFPLHSHLSPLYTTPNPRHRYSVPPLSSSPPFLSSTPSFISPPSPTSLYPLLAPRLIFPRFTYPDFRLHPYISAYPLLVTQNTSTCLSFFLPLLPSPHPLSNITLFTAPSFLFLRSQPHIPTFNITFSCFSVSPRSSLPRSLPLFQASFSNLPHFLSVLPSPLLLTLAPHLPFPFTPHPRNPFFSFPFFLLVPSPSPFPSLISLLSLLLHSL